MNQMGPQSVERRQTPMCGRPKQKKKKRNPFQGIQCSIGKVDHDIYLSYFLPLEFAQIKPSSVWKMENGKSIWISGHARSHVHVDVELCCRNFICSSELRVCECLLLRLSSTQNFHAAITVQCPLSSSIHSCAAKTTGFICSCNLFHLTKLPSNAQTFNWPVATHIV